MRDGKPARAAGIAGKAELRPLQLLSAKPVLYIANVDEADAAGGNAESRRVAEFAAAQGAGTVVISAAIEAELTQLADDDERREYLAALGLDEPGLTRVIRAGYRLLDLVTFLTVGPKEARAWTVPNGSQGAAGRRRDPHRFREGLHPRRDDLLRAISSPAAASRAPRTPARCVSRAPSMSSQDGDIMHFRFNV